MILDEIINKICIFRKKKFTILKKRFSIVVFLLLRNYKFSIPIHVVKKKKEKCQRKD